MFREFLRGRAQLLLSDKKPSRSAEDMFDEFLRSLGKHQ